MVVTSTQNWLILAKFAKKNPAKSAVFYWLFLGEVSPRNFPWNRLIFLRICPWKSFEIWLFSAKIPRNLPIFLWIFTFLPWKSREIRRFFHEFWLFPAKTLRNWPIFLWICPWKSRKISLFFPRNIRSPGYVKEKLDDGHFQGSHVSCKRNGTLYDNKPFFSFGGI